MRVYADADIPRECYPVHVAWFGIASGACLDSLTVYEPGPVDAPAAATWPEPVRVVLTFANGDREEYPRPLLNPPPEGWGPLLEGL